MNVLRRRVLVGLLVVSAIALSVAPRLSVRGRTLLHCAVLRNHCATATVLLALGADANRVDTRSGLPPLHMAVSGHDSAPMVRLLLRHHARPNELDERGQTALQLALSTGFPEPVRALLEGGADPNATNGAGETALHVAARWRPEWIDILMERGGQVDQADLAGQTPLMAAAGAGSADAVTALLSYRANPNVMDSDGKTPLMLASQLHEGSPAVAALLKGGPKVNMQDKAGITALHYAAPGAAKRQSSIRVTLGGLRDGGRSRLTQPCVQAPHVNHLGPARSAAAISKKEAMDAGVPSVTGHGFRATIWRHHHTRSETRASLNAQANRSARQGDTLCGGERYRSGRLRNNAPHPQSSQLGAPDAATRRVWKMNPSVVNPYTNYGRITNPDDFYGREAELREVFSFIGGTQPQCVSIVGERRIGKSSLLAMVSHPDVARRHLPSPKDYVFVYVDLLETGGWDEAELWTVLAEEIWQQSGLAEHPETGPNADEETLAGRYAHVKCLIEQLGAAGKKIILVLDEFETVTRNAYCSLDCLGRFRALASTYELGMVTATRTELADACHDPQLSTSPFFNIFAISITLGPLAGNALAALVTEKSTTAGCTLTPDLPWVSEVSGGFAYVAQRACYELFRFRTERNRSDGKPLTGGEYSQLQTALQEWLEPFLNHLWEALSDDARQVLTRAAQGKPIHDRMANVAAALERYGLVRENRPFSPLLGTFIAEKPRRSLRRLPWRWTIAAAIAIVCVWGVQFYVNVPSFQETWQYFAGLATIAAIVPLVGKLLAYMNDGPGNEPPREDDTGHDQRRATRESDAP